MEKSNSGSMFLSLVVAGLAIVGGITVLHYFLSKSCGSKSNHQVNYKRGDNASDMLLKHKSSEECIFPEDMLEEFPGNQQHMADLSGLDLNIYDEHGNPRDSF